MCSNGSAPGSGRRRGGWIRGSGAIFISDRPGCGAYSSQFESQALAVVAGAAVCSVAALGLGVLYAMRARWSLLTFVVFLTEPLRGADAIAVVLRTGLLAVGFVAVALTGLAVRPHPLRARGPARRRAGPRA